MLDKIKNQQAGQLKKLIVYVLITTFLIGSFFVIPRGDPEHAEGGFHGVFGVPQAKAVVNEEINIPTTWTLANSPYIIGWNTRINVNNVLTIEPGVVIKFTPHRRTGWHSSLVVNGDVGGQIIAQGTLENPIVFTSLYDNDYDSSVGTEQDPQPGDWFGIAFNNDQSILEHVIVGYAGGQRRRLASLEFNNNSSANVSNSTIDFSQTRALMIEGDSQPVLDNLILENNSQGALYASSTAGPGELKNSLIQNNQGHYLMNISANSLFKFSNNTYLNNFSNRVRFRDNVTQDVTWTDVGLPYLVTNTIQVEPGNTVTIEPGVIIKFETFASYIRLLVNGNLQALGTLSQPIIFTSSNDDVGGDTNNDGNASLPAALDWGEIAFEDSSGSQLDYVEIRYAGSYYGGFNGIFYTITDHNSILLDNSQVDINHTVIEHGNQFGILQKNGGSFSLQNSQIKNHDRGIYVSADVDPLPVIKNNQFDDNTRCALEYAGQEQMLDARYNWWGHDSGPTHPDNPGGMGDRIEGNVDFDPWIGKEPEPVILLPGIMASWPDLSGELKIDPFFKTYENLLDALRLAGYEDDVNLFQFPYQWRQSNTTTAEQLKVFIDYVKAETQKPKVDLVGHSMGGIVSRTYIQSDYYEDDVDQLIFLGTPHQGSVNAYITWESGGALIKGLTDVEPRLLNLIFTIEARAQDFSDLFEYVRDRVISVQQLLPIFDYIRDKGEVNLREYSNNYPRNEFLEDLNSTLNNEIEKLKSRVNITNIVSNLGPQSTVDVLRVVPYTGADGKWEHGYPEDYGGLSGDYGLEYGPGDETVPFQSAIALDGVPHTLCQSVHRPMPTNCQQLVIQALTGQVPTEFINEDRFNGLNFIRNFIMMWFFSPVDFNIEDSQGNKVGQDLSTGHEINEIQGAFVGKIGDKKVIFVPNPNNGEYKINLKGTGDGEYELNIVKGDEEGFQETVVTSTINNGQEKTYVTNYDEESDESLVLEEQDFQSIINEVTNFYEQGLITREYIKRLLIWNLTYLEEQYNQLDEPNKPWCGKGWENLIIIRLESLKKQVDWWHETGYIKNPAYNILINNFNFLIQMLNDLN